MTIASGLDMPNGVAFKNGALYIAEQSKITRYDKVLQALPKLPQGVPIRLFERFVGYTFAVRFDTQTERSFFIVLHQHNTLGNISELVQITKFIPQ